MPSDASLPLATSGRTGIRRRSFVPRATDRAPDSDEGIVLKNRQPAEWSPHQSVWTAWPSATDLWLEDLAPAREEVGAPIRSIDDGGSGEIVEVIAAKDRAVADAAQMLRGTTPHSPAPASGEIRSRAEQGRSGAGGGS